jgi:hypothetical protein
VWLYLQNRVKEKKNRKKEMGCELGYKLGITNFCTEWAKSHL